MDNKPIYLGIDGCKAGWWVWSLNDGKLKYGVYSSLERLFSGFSEPVHCLIDMPIGFSDPVTPDRICDKAARKLLTKVKQSCVFPVPCREAVYSANYQIGSAVNQQRLGKRLSKQTWNIVSKIRELDEYLQRNETHCIRESHPELVFTQLACQPLMTRKRSKEGREERLYLLRSISPVLEQAVVQALSSTLRKHAMADDIIDALVLCIASQSHDSLIRVPNFDDFDSNGRCREIVYPNQFRFPQVSVVATLDSSPYIDNSPTEG